MTPTLVCLAAGSSSRYGRPKQLEPVGPHGATLLDFTLADAAAAGVRVAAVVIREEAREAFEQGIRARWAKRMAVELVVQHPRSPGASPWGTVDAVLAAAPMLDGSFLVANADDFYGRDTIVEMARALTRLPTTVARALVAGFPLGMTLSPAGGVHRALLHERDGSLSGIEEVRDIRAAEDDDGHAIAPGAPPRRLPLDARVSMNLWGFTPAILPDLRRELDAFRRGAGQSDELRIADVVETLTRSGALEVAVITARGPWAGLTHPGDREATSALLHELTARGEYPMPVWRA